MPTADPSDIIHVSCLVQVQNVRYIAFELVDISNRGLVQNLGLSREWPQ